MCVCVGVGGCVGGCVFSQTGPLCVCVDHCPNILIDILQRGGENFFNYLAKQFKNSLQNNNNNKKKDFTKIAAIAGL